jgi:uncharacterized protein
MSEANPSSLPLSVPSYPVPATERLFGLDVLRGFALLGILLMNIRSFGLIGAAYFFPVAYGDLTGMNLAAWWFTDLFADMKFISLFSMLFGAGVVLQTQRADSLGRRSGRIYYRRLLWLWLFGMVHAYCFWDGDILVPYAVAGLLLYPMRRVRAGRLLITGLVFAVIGSAVMLLAGLSGPYWPESSMQAFNADWQPGAEAIGEELTALRGTWADEFQFRVPHVLEMHLIVIPFFFFWRTLGMMLLGMALFKMQLLDGSFRTAHKFFIVLGLVVGLPLTITEGVRQFARGWEPIPSFMIDSVFGSWGSILMALGYLGLIFLAVSRGWLAGMQSRLAAVGRMALSNYLMHTVLCTFLFYGRGLGLFGKVPHIGLLGVVLSVWALQLWLSPWWLARFRFGPLEWVWRSLTYLQKQPFRR